MSRHGLICQENFKQLSSGEVCLPRPTPPITQPSPLPRCRAFTPLFAYSFVPALWQIVHIQPFFLCWFIVALHIRALCHCLKVNRTVRHSGLANECRLQMVLEGICWALGDLKPNKPTYEHLTTESSIMNFSTFSVTCYFSGILGISS